MIGIRTYNDKWQMPIDSECWEFETRFELDKCLKAMLDFKGNYGKISNFKKGAKNNGC